MSEWNGEERRNSSSYGALVNRLHELDTSVQLLVAALDNHKRQNHDLTTKMAELVQSHHQEIYGGPQRDKPGMKDEIISLRNSWNIQKETERRYRLGIITAVSISFVHMIIQAIKGALAHFIKP